MKTPTPREACAPGPAPGCVGVRKDRVRADPELCPLDCERSREPHQPRLRRRVVREAAHAEGACARARQDDAAVAAVAHHDEGRLEDEECATHVGVEHLVELLHRQVLEVRVAEHAGVGDHRVDRSERLERTVDDGAATLGGGDRVVRRDRRATGGHDLRHDCLGFNERVRFAPVTACGRLDDFPALIVGGQLRRSHISLHIIHIECICDSRVIYPKYSTGCRPRHRRKQRRIAQLGANCLGSLGSLGSASRSDFL